MTDGCNPSLRRLEPDYESGPSGKALSRPFEEVRSAFFLNVSVRIPIKHMHCPLTRQAYI
jgi:hypothetical protein